MRKIATTVTMCVLVLASAQSAMALNDTAPTVTTNTDFESACSIRVPRPPTPTGDDRPDGKCSCVLVGEQVILTTSNCLAVNVEDSDPPLTAGIEVQFVIDGPTYAVDDIALYRYYDSSVTAVDGLAGDGFTEFAMAHLTTSPGITPAVVNTSPLNPNFQNATVTLLGYGATTASSLDIDFGNVRRGIEAPVRNLLYTHFWAGSEDSTTCPGDEGGPVFADIGGEVKLVAITQADLLSRCFDNINRMRVDTVANQFIIPYIARYQSGADCNRNGVCASGCEFDDVDCDTCAWQGVASGCDESCAPRDFDCALGSLPGFECETDSDCEFGGRCLAAEDDSTFKYCTSPCDDAGLTGPKSCSNGQTCVAAGPVGDECQYGTPSRGSQGFACVTNSDCRSDICEGDICVFECNGPGDCPAGTECLPSQVAGGTNVCRLPGGGTGGGGFCAIQNPGAKGSGAPLGFVFFAAFAAIFALRQRRRR